MCWTCGARRDPAATRRGACSALLLEVIGIPAARVPLRPGIRRALQLPGAVLRQPARRRRRLAARGPAAARGGAGRPAAATCGDQSWTSCEVAAASPRRSRASADAHAETLMPDQTYLQQAQPSTFGHYVLSFAYPALREAQPAGSRRWRGSTAARAGRAASTAAGCAPTAATSRRCSASTASSSTPATPCGRPTAWSTCSRRRPAWCPTQSKLAEDLEIWASQEFDYVDLADGRTPGRAC